MMKTLRKSVSGWVAKLLLGLVVVAFVITGFSDFFSGPSANAVLSVGGTDVLVQDYRLAYRQAEVRLEQQLQRRATREEAVADGIDQRVMSQLVAEAVLDEQGRGLGLGLSEDRLARLIADDASFQDQSGRFSRAAFRELLSSVGMTENEFIRNRQEAAVRLQIVEAVSEGATAPTLIKQAFGLYNGERRSADYLTLPLALVEPVAEPAPDVLQAYFDRNRDRYRAPEYRSISYATLSPEAIADAAAITDQQIAEDFARNSARFTTPERRLIEQIVYPDKAAADAAKAELDGGKLFEQLVIQSGRTLADTRLGYLARSEIPDPAIAEAAFALAEHAAAVVEGAFGPVLLRVAEIQPETKQPLEAVKEDIRKELALAAAADAVQQAYDTFEDARAGGGTLQEAAVRAGLTAKTVPAVARTGETPEGQPVTDLPEPQALLQGAFEADVGVETTPINLQPNGYVFYEVTKIDPARDRPLDEVKAAVVADWKRSEAEDLLDQRAEALKKRLEAGETMDAIAAAEKLAKGNVASITRRSGLAEIGEDGVRAVFSGGAGVLATADAADGDGRLLIKVTQVAPPIDPLAVLPPGQDEQLSSMFQSDLLQLYVALLQVEYPVFTYPAAIQAAQAVQQ